MPQAQRSVLIGRPLEAVFAFFTDPANDHRWRPQVISTVSQGPPVVGERIHVVVTSHGGRGVPADIEVTAYEPASRYAFRAAEGPVRPRGEYRFAPYGSGTEVTFVLDAEIRGLRKLFLSARVQKSLDGEMRALETAKRLLELG
ncbi:MAG TPA: SRPBCC family protein [Oryzihumus sp.]|nr:SRPBCC family protein [Oryzihumus sp.]